MRGRQRDTLNCPGLGGKRLESLKSSGRDRGPGLDWQKKLGKYRNNLKHLWDQSCSKTQTDTEQDCPVGKLQGVHCKKFPGLEPRQPDWGGRAWSPGGEEETSTCFVVEILTCLFKFLFFNFNKFRVSTMCFQIWYKPNLVFGFHFSIFSFLFPI